MATVLSATGAITSLDITLPSSASAGVALPGYTTRTATATLLSGTYYITTTYTYLTQTTPTPTTPVSITQTGAATSTRRITSGSITRTGTSTASRTSTTSRATGIAAASSGGGNKLPAGAITAIAIVSTLVVICLFTAWAYWYRRRNVRRRIAAQRVEVDGEEAVPSPRQTSGGSGWTTPWDRARSPPPPSYTHVRTELDTEKLAGASGTATASGSAGRTSDSDGAAGAGSEGAPVSGYILEDESDSTPTLTPTPDPAPAPASASSSNPQPEPASVLRPNLPNPRRGDNRGESSMVVQDGPARGIRESLATGRIEQADDTSETVLLPPTYGSLYPRGR